MIRPGQPEDLPAVAAIQTESPEAAAWNPADYLAHLFFVLGEPPAAFAVARRVADGEYELLNLAVSSAARRQGYGESLLRFAIESYPGDWYLEVRASNQAARKLYEKLGFRAVGRRPDYYRMDNYEKWEEGIVFHRPA